MTQVLAQIVISQARFPSQAIGIEADGFSDKTYCLLPDAHLSSQEYVSQVGELKCLPAGSLAR
jgi:hypothetical protein